MTSVRVIALFHGLLAIFLTTPLLTSMSRKTRAGNFQEAFNLTLLYRIWCVLLCVVTYKVDQQSTKKTPKVQNEIDPSFV